MPACRTGSCAAGSPADHQFSRRPGARGGTRPLISAITVPACLLIVSFAPLSTRDIPNTPTPAPSDQPSSASQPFVSEPSDELDAIAATDRGANAVIASSNEATPEQGVVAIPSATASKPALPAATNPEATVFAVSDWSAMPAGNGPAETNGDEWLPMTAGLIQRGPVESDAFPTHRKVRVGSGAHSMADIQIGYGKLFVNESTLNDEATRLNRVAPSCAYLQIHFRF